MPNFIFAPLLKKTIFLSFFCLVFFTLLSQTTWETEREKEHGVLRICIDGLSLDDYYYFVYRHPQTHTNDTLRNQEMHLDLGNPEPPYSYNMGRLLKAMPGHLYGKSTEFIYEHWDYVSFPIVGLAEAQIVVTNSENETMRIYFEFEAGDTADYVFQMNFQEGDFLVEAPLLKTFALSSRFRELHFTLDPSALLHTPFNRLYQLKVIPSQTDNPRLSIIDIGNPAPLKCFPFCDKIRYATPSEFSVHSLEHPYYKKMKSRSPMVCYMAPDYMKADPNDPGQFIYCVENIYVKPVYLYLPSVSKYPVRREDVQVNRKPHATVGDTTFLRLEAAIEAMLFSGRNPCNEPYYSVSEVHFPWNSDSMVCVEISETHFRLPKEDSLVLSRYVLKLDKAMARAARKSKLKNRRFLRWRVWGRRRVSHVPMMPKRELKALPLPDYKVDVPQWCDTILGRFPFTNSLDNGYYRWEPVKPCLNLQSPEVYSRSFYTFVVNPYTMKPYDPNVLFGSGFREVVYEEIIKEYNRLKESDPDVGISVNAHPYKPEIQREWMWGIDQRNLIIYYGNEGEIRANRKLLIPYERFLE